MKTIVLLILFSTGFICCFGQNDFRIKPLPRIEFNDYAFKLDTNRLGLSPKSPVDSILNYYQIPEQNRNELNLQKLGEMIWQYSSGNMPIARVPEGNWNMPIVVADSTVHYYIRNAMKVTTPAVIKK